MGGFPVLDLALSGPVEKTALLAPVIAVSLTSGIRMMTMNI